MQTDACIRIHAHTDMSYISLSAKLQYASHISPVAIILCVAMLSNVIYVQLKILFMN
jgi:hypothetical protein